MTGLIPAFDFQEVILDPWRYDAGGVLRIMLMGFFANATCGLVGAFLVFRRMALTGDAISHSLLPGIVVAFIVTSSRDILPMMAGAVIAGIVCVLLVELIHRQSRVKHDAALGIVFSTLFALGIIILSLYADEVDLDPDCVLYGEIGFIPFMPDIMIGSLTLGPRPVLLMAVMLIVCVVLLLVFYKELLVSSFDPALATSLGIRPQVYHYGLMLAVSLTVVGAFEAVGAILVIAMLIFPAVTAAMIATRLPFVLAAIIPLSLLYTAGGYHLALWLDTSIAGAMVVVAAFIFGVIWLFSPGKGFIWQQKSRDLKDPAW